MALRHQGLDEGLLEVTDEESEQLYRLPDSDPRKPMVMAYLWLGALQESLVETLMS